MTPDLAAWRKLHGFTQARGAVGLGVSLSTWRNWEKGYREVPGFGQISIRREDSREAVARLRLLLAAPEPLRLMYKARRDVSIRRTEND